MAQGLIKKSAKPASSSHKAKKQAVSTGGAAPKKFARVTKAPRKAKAVKTHASANKAMHKFTAGLIGKTEAMLGERAGHLELIGPGKKKDAMGNKKGSKENIGGSRRYG